MSCKIPNDNDYILIINNICEQCVQYNIEDAHNFIKTKLIDLINETKNLPNSSEHLLLLSNLLDEYYNTPGDDYADVLIAFFSKDFKDALFMLDNSNEPKKDIPSFEEMSSKGKKIRSKDFIKSRFKNSSYAQLYFERSVKHDMIEAFLVQRSGDYPKFYETLEDLNKHVKEYKLQLLDKVFEYFNSNSLLLNLVKGLPKLMYDSNGNYLNTIKKIKDVVDGKLSYKYLENSSIKSLDDYYIEFKTSKNLATKNNAKLFLDAYNAWILLNNFDTIVENTIGNIIKVTNQFDNHTGDLRKYEFTTKATNMWNNWTDSDDIADMADVISEVTQMLLETSKMYKWGVKEPYTDRYLSFLDYNYVIGNIKKLAFDPKKSSVVISGLKNIDTLSIHTRKILLDIQLDLQRNGDASQITLKHIISRINENPQRYLHAIFDIFCNTNIITEGFLNFDKHTQNLIWSLNEELFSHTTARSLYKLHINAKLDNIYLILTQVAASTFPEEYLQYYERTDNSIGTRLLRDFAVEDIKNSLITTILEKGNTISSKLYDKYGITLIDRPNTNNHFLDVLKVSIPITDNYNFEIIVDRNNVRTNIADININLLHDIVSKIWENQTFQSLIKDTLGIDFVNDPDLFEAYFEQLNNINAVIGDLSKILGRALFTSAINTIYTARYKGATTEEKFLKLFLELQYGLAKALEYTANINKSTGYIPLLPTSSKDSDLNNLSLAKALTNNLLSQAQSKTGEGTALANYTLSRLRNFFHNQLEILCKRKNSASNHMTFVVNTNNLFEGILSRREIKTLKTAQQSTKFSDEQSFLLAFVNDFISAYILNPNGKSFLKEGRASFLPTVNSDKPLIDGLLVNLYAKSHISDGRGGYKRYIDLTDSEIEQEMQLEFKPFYDKVVQNIITELNRIVTELQKIYPKNIIPEDDSVISKHRAFLEYINLIFYNDESLGEPKERVKNGLHKIITQYNKTHHKNPIMLAENIHYVVKDGLLLTNKTLEALWGRFNTGHSNVLRANLSALYKNDVEYRNFVNDSDLDLLSTKAFFQWLDYQTIKDLLGMGFKINLRGSDDVVRHNLDEIKFLRGDVTYTLKLRTLSEHLPLIQLNAEMQNWVSDDGLMIIAKGVTYENGIPTIVNITSLEDLNKVSNIELHPMLRRLNRLDYLCSQQYTVSTVGSHYAHSSGKKDYSTSVLVEEALRWLASNKRNVAATSTVHLFQNKQLNGAPSMYNIAIIEDITTDLYTVMGDLYREGHKPLDGGMFCCGWLSILENNSLAGEAAGGDKKQFGTFYDERYGAGGIVKTAGFAVTCTRMRRSKSWLNLQKAMSSGKWLKEHPNDNGEDVLENGKNGQGLDITKDFLNNTINYKTAIGNLDIYYKRECYDDPNLIAAYKQQGIEKLIPGLVYKNPITGKDFVAGLNDYIISEIEVDAHGIGVGGVKQRLVSNLDNNWSLFNEVFGGMYSLELGTDNVLTWSENSIKLMAHAVNNVGYKKDTSKYNSILSDFNKNKTLSGELDVIETGLDLDDVWQPLKYSDIHYIPNIGAIKSLQYNVNPDGEAVLEGKSELNYAIMRLAQLGIQLDKEHYADLSEVTMPTQIIQALANKSYSHEDAKEVYEALSILARQVSTPFVEGIRDIITAEDPSILIEEVTNLLLENVLHKKGNNDVLDSIFKELIDKAERGDKISFAEDINGKVAWSDPRITKKLFSDLSTTLSNLGIKMKFSGILSVICPADKGELLYGDKSLTSFTSIYDKGTKSTRTTISENNLKTYLESVKAGKETDSDGRNMLIFDEIRDLTSIMERKLEESEELYDKRVLSDIRRKKLSLVSELKTLHNYVIEYSDGSKDEITINTPIEYNLVKNLIIHGKKVVGNTINGKSLITPVTYEELLKEQIPQYAEAIENNEDNDLEHIVCRYLIGNPITYESFKKELGGDKTPEMRSMLRFFRKPEKGGINIDQLAHIIYDDYAETFPNTLDIKNKIIEVLLSKTQYDIFNYSNNLANSLAALAAEYEYHEYEKYILAEYNMTAEEYAERYELYQNGPLAVVKIYEDVIKPRTLSAYNVRFSDAGNIEDRFLLYDLDSVNVLFNLNNLFTEKPPKGYVEFLNQSIDLQKLVLKKLFNYLKRINRLDIVQYRMRDDLKNDNIILDDTFINSLTADNFKNIIDTLYAITKPIVFRHMQKDLFRLSPNYKIQHNQNDKIWVNNRLVDPINVQADAYELIMPKIYQTQFGLLLYDDLQEILRDKNFFIKRGLERFKCKLEHSSYDYELKNFNGEHVYILDANKEIPAHIAENILPIFKETKKGKLYRTDSDGNNIYELSSDKDTVCKIGNTQIIVTKNPLFYVEKLNYNTLKVSPKRVTEEDYSKLISKLSKSKRANSKNFLKAISVTDNTYMSLDEFKKFNIAIDNINYGNVFIEKIENPEFKSVTQICKIIIENGKELHTAFNTSLDVIAGRIPAQSQLSFMTLRVVMFDDSEVNTAMVSTFQLFLQGSDLDIDAVTLLGYAFDKNGKFIKWSPYFKSNTLENFKASKLIPLPTGKKGEIVIDKDAENNFYNIYDKYFGTLILLIPLENGKYKTEDGVLKLQIVANTPEQIGLLAEFLRDYNKYGINIKGELAGNNVNIEESDLNIKYNLFRQLPNGLGFRPDQIQAAAEQLLKFADDHNDYINTAEDYEKNEMVKNYIVTYIYKVSSDPCNLTEALLSVDKVTEEVKDEAANSAMSNASNSYAPGRTVTKIKSIGEGQAGKLGVGIGAVGIKANSTTQFYLSELWKNGTIEDKRKITFEAKVIKGKVYTGFANMYTTAEFSEQERENFKHAIELLEKVHSEKEITKNVSLELSSLLSISVDNAKDLALAKINAGPRLMGMFAYGLSIGMSIKALVGLMTSELGLILKELSEGSYFNNDNVSFGILNIFDKLRGNIGSDIKNINVIGKDSNGNTIKLNSDIIVTLPNKTNKRLTYGSTKDTLFVLMYDKYKYWVTAMTGTPNSPELAATFEGMVSLLIRHNQFSTILEESLALQENVNILNNLKNLLSGENRLNWEASFKQLIKYITNIEAKAKAMDSENGKDLRILAEGAEEMRVLGLILGLNKGLKPSMSEMETFIETIENLIYDRKKAMGIIPDDSDKIDFIKFMTDKEYQNKIIEAYEDIKHSVNIPHLLSKVPHFNDYLLLLLIPQAFFNMASITYRTLHKYRKNVHADSDTKPVSLFNFFGVNSRKDKESVLRGFENMINFKLFARWAYDNKLTFKVPKGFKYFTKMGELTSNSEEEVPINLWTLSGLATFKKYMEEVYIPDLKQKGLDNEFIKNLEPYSMDRTATHNTVSVYSLPGDLMSAKGRQGELNKERFAAFKSLHTLNFLPDSKLASAIDAFYIYSLYCYLGKKSLKSLLSAFDNVQNCTLKQSFEKHIATMDASGNISCSPEEIIVWCAPEGSLFSSSEYIYGTLDGKFGKQLLVKNASENVRLSEDLAELMQQMDSADIEEGGGNHRKVNRYSLYSLDYNMSLYDRLTKNNFLIPRTLKKVEKKIAFTMQIDEGFLIESYISILQDMIVDISVMPDLKLDNYIKETSKDSNGVSRYDSWESFKRDLLPILRNCTIPYKVNLFKDSKQELDIAILNTIIELQLKC